MQLRRLIAVGLFVLGGGVVARGEEANIYFPTAGIHLDGKGKAEVKKLAKHLAPDSKVQLMGSADPRGSEDVNRRIRGERAEGVRAALIAAGVSEDRIETQDFENIEGLSADQYWKLRRTRITYTKGDGAKVASTATTETPKPEVVTTTTTTTKPEATTTTTSTGIKPEAGNTGMATAKLGPNGKPLEPINLIYWRSFNHALWIIAKEKGFFEEEGFDANLKETDQDAKVLAREVIHTLPEGVTSTDALKRGKRKFFAGAICGYGAHEAMSRGEPVVDIGSMIMIPESLIMSKDLATAIDKNLGALKGKKIADFTYGQGEHDFKYMNVLRGQLEKMGVKEGRDYQITEYLDQTKTFTDLIAHKIDVVKAFPGQDVEFVQAHPEFVRVPFAKFFPYLPCCRQLVTRANLKDHRADYVRLLRASIKAHEFTIYHPVEAAQILSKWLKLPAKVVRTTIMSSYVSLTPDPMRKGVELFQRTNDKATGTHTSTAEYIDTSLYRDALLSLKSEDKNPGDQGYYDTMVSRFRANN